MSARGRTVLSLGSVNADFEMRVDRPPGSAETLPAHALRRLGGGKAANVAFLARRFGHAARLLGRVGEDELAEQALAPLREAGVQLSAVARARGCATGVAMIAVPPSGKKQIVLAGNANDGWSEAEIAAMAACIEAAEAPAILVADYEVPAEVVRRAVDAAARRGIPVVIDPAFPDRAERAVLARARAITPNAEEARALAGGDGDEAATARALVALGAELACLKLDDGGCLLATRERLVRVPSAGMELVDSTGAGDAFAGALAVALLEGKSPEDAALLAVAASDLSVAGYGAQPSYPERARVEAHAALLQWRVQPWNDQ